MINGQPAPPGTPHTSGAIVKIDKRGKWAVPSGRPPKLSPEDRQRAYDAFKAYIDITPDPTIPGFISFDPTALELELYYHNLKDWQEFSPLIKRAVTKQEAYLLMAVGVGRYNPALGIFRLKQPQHGYTDKTVQEQQLTVVTPLMQLEQGKERKVIDAESTEQSVDELFGDE